VFLPFCYFITCGHLLADLLYEQPILFAENSLVFSSQTRKQLDSIQSPTRYSGTQ
jgi:hypothetical protein